MEMDMEMEIVLEGMGNETYPLNTCEIHFTLPLNLPKGGGGCKIMWGEPFACEGCPRDKVLLLLFGEEDPDPEDPPPAGGAALPSAPSDENFPSQELGLGGKELKKNKGGKMKMKLLEIQAGVLGNCQAGIFFSGNKIFCESLNKIYECDMSQLGHGGTAICPLCGFVLDVENKFELLRWWKYLNNWNMKEVARVLENFLFENKG
jgi:hypothetical protein